MATLTEMDQRKSDAVEARSELDLRIGAAFTRLQTLTLQPRFEDLNKRIISYGMWAFQFFYAHFVSGPCQFPTVGFVIDRYMRIQSFVPEPFWKLVVRHRKVRLANHLVMPINPFQANVDVSFHWQRNHLFDEQICQALYDRCSLSMPARVAMVQTRPTTK